MIKIAALFIVTAAFAFEARSLNAASNEVEEGYITAYGRGIVEYNKQLRARNDKISPAERKRIYDEAFSAAKQALQKEKQESQNNLNQLRADIKAEVQKDMPSVNEEPEKKPALATVDETEQPPSSTSRTPATTARLGSTGEVGQAGGADIVNFKEAIKSSDPSVKVPLGDSAGAETVKFSAE